MCCIELANLPCKDDLYSDVNLKKIIFILMAPYLGLAFFSRDQRQLGKDLLIVYAKCLVLVCVMYFISLFPILTAGTTQREGLGGL